MGQKQRKGAEKREKQAKQKAQAQAVEVAKQKHHLSRKKWATQTIKEMVFVLCIAAVAVRTLRKFYARYAPLVRPAEAADLPLLDARADVFGPAVAHSLASCADAATRKQARVVALFSDEAAFRAHAATACFAPVLRAALLPAANAFRLHVLRSDFAATSWHFDEAATTRMDTRYAALATSAYYVDAGGGDVEVARSDEAWSRQHASDKPAALEALAALSAEAGPRRLGGRS
ncbi:tRNA (guanine-N2-)-methyltransferase [Aureococcus anophagefferens]|nr:tRNA (guanine-N2-)-methyltransferase [Aureococcus anophagefferens]